MHEANVPDVLTLHKILEDQSGKYSQENCIRKCLYKEMFLVNENGEINVSVKL